jgi:hypothetical protein
LRDKFCGVASVRAASPVVRILDLDPDLGQGIDEAEWKLASRECLGDLVRMHRGPSRLPSGHHQIRDWFAFVIMKGLVCREIALRDHHMVELLGPGDVLQLPVAAGRPALGGPVRLTAIDEAVLIALGGTFVGAAARWPSLLQAVMERIEVQRELLAVQAVIGHLPLAEHRALLMLSHLANRWGRVTPGGVLLPLPLTHQLIGKLIAARRSTVTLALSPLEADGSLVRLEDGSWLLTDLADAKVAAIARTSDRPTGLGQSLMLRRLSRENTSASIALRAEAEQVKAQRGV